MTINKYWCASLFIAISTFMAVQSIADDDPILDPAYTGMYFDCETSYSIKEKNIDGPPVQAVLPHGTLIVQPHHKPPPLPPPPPTSDEATSDNYLIFHGIFRDKNGKETKINCYYNFFPS